jgi:DNA invertase Pin-like site-specific DNA recombinase
MSAGHSSNGRPVPAAAYYRCSDPRQEDSPERQRSQVEPYAARHGYRIVREYLDEGISGNEAGKRKAFLQMLRDAQAGVFEAILVDEDDRFCRFDSIDYGYYVKPLRDKGITLVTADKGPVDWNSFSGRITSAVQVEGKNQEQGSIARRVLSQMLRMAKAGEHLGGKPPYGLRLVRKAVVVPGKGEQLKPDRYEPDGLKAETVKLIFRLYDEGWSLPQIRVALHDRGVLSPGGREWWGRQAILEKLTNPKYTGATAWGTKSEGKRYHQRKGEVRERKPGENQYARNRPEDWVVVPEKHEALVDQELFARVQARLRGGRKQKGKPPGSGGRFVLSKLLVCGHCHHMMCGITIRGKVQYICAGYLNYGKDFCHKNTLSEEPIVRFLVGELQRTFLNPDNLAKLRQEALDLEMEARGEDNLQRLERRLAALDRDLVTAHRNLLFLSVDRIRGAEEQLRLVEKEREGVAAELRLAQTFSPVLTLEEQVREVEAALFGLHEALAKADRILLRELLRQLVSKIVVHFEHRVTGSITRSRFTHAVVYRRQDERLDIMASSVCPG